MGEVHNGDQKVRKYLFSEIFYGRQAVSYEELFSRIIWFRGVKEFLEKFRQLHNLKISNRLSRSKSFFQKIFLVLYAAYAYPFWVVSLWPRKAFASVGPVWMLEGTE